MYRASRVACRPGADRHAHGSQCLRPAPPPAAAQRFRGWPPRSTRRAAHGGRRPSPAAHARRASSLRRAVDEPPCASAASRLRRGSRHGIASLTPKRERTAEPGDADGRRKALRSAASERESERCLATLLSGRSQASAVCVSRQFDIADHVGLRPDTGRAARRRAAARRRVRLVRPPPSGHGSGAGARVLTSPHRGSL